MPTVCIKSNDFGGRFQTFMFIFAEIVNARELWLPGFIFI
jgi:hypothetical protein